MMTTRVLSMPVFPMLKQFADDDMDDEMRQVLRMSLLEAEGNTAEAERLRQSLQQKSSASPGPVLSSITSEASPSRVGSAPRSKVEQLKNGASMSSDDPFPSLSGFRQMPTR